jgi:hypothetical protein
MELILWKNFEQVENFVLDEVFRVNDEDEMLDYFCRGADIIMRLL